jgi:hypothetical protein
MIAAEKRERPFAAGFAISENYFPVFPNSLFD